MQQTVKNNYETKGNLRDYDSKKTPHTPVYQLPFIIQA